MDEVREAAREKSRLWITARELGSAVLPDMDGDIELAPPVVILEPPLTVSSGLTPGMPTAAEAGINAAQEAALHSAAHGPCRLLRLLGRSLSRQQHCHLSDSSLERQRGVL